MTNAAPKGGMRFRVHSIQEPGPPCGGKHTRKGALSEVAPSDRQANHVAMFPYPDLVHGGSATL